jgi:hypothetical protein
MGGNLQIGGVVNALTARTTRTFIGGQFSEAGNTATAQIACLYAASPVGVEPAIIWSELNLRLSPNPARAATAIEFELAAPAHVRIDVFDVAGRLVGRVHDGPRAAGRHRVVWEPGMNGPGAGPGVYFVRLQTANRTLLRSLVLIR